MRISVVIPAYNEEKYIAACLESLAKQIVKPDEIIVVNNRSSDNTVNIAKQYQVRIVNEKHQGIIQARNRGFNEAKYDIIARTDADTVVPRNWIKKIKKSFSNEKVIAVSGSADFYDLPEVIQNSKLPTKTVFKSYVQIIKKILRHDSLYGPNMAIRKSAWEKVKNSVCMNNKDVHEDVDLAIHLAPYGEIKYDAGIVVQSSFRRFKRLTPYFEYPYRMLKGIQKHKQIVTKQKGKQLVKRIVSKALLIDFLF